VTNSFLVSRKVDFLAAYEKKNQEYRETVVQQRDDMLEQTKKDFTQTTGGMMKPTLLSNRVMELK
jgi:hypothetical protein